jgi:hypothetical protein
MTLRRRNPQRHPHLLDVRRRRGSEQIRDGVVRVEPAPGEPQQIISGRVDAEPTDAAMSNCKTCVQPTHPRQQCE